MRKLGLLLSTEQVDRRDEAMDVWRKLLEGGDDIEALGTLALWDEEKQLWMRTVPIITKNGKRELH